MPGKKVRFGEFELDFNCFRLSRSGKAVRLEGLPLQLLMFLVERQSELVTRKQIADVLWGDVFVDVEQGINTAIRKIRLALDDNLLQPRYLQTVVGRGYRFVGEISVEGDGFGNGDQFHITAEEFGQALMAAAGLHPEDIKTDEKRSAILPASESDLSG